MTVRILNDYQQYQVQAMRQEGHTLKAIAQTFNVSADTISKVVRGRKILLLDAAEHNGHAFADLFGDCVAEGKRYVVSIPDDRSSEFYDKLLWAVNSEYKIYKWGAEAEKHFTKLTAAIVNASQTTSEAEEIETVEDAQEDFELPEIDASSVIWSGNSRFLSIVVDGQVYNADASLPRFKDALQACVDGQFAKAVAIVNVERAVASYTSKSGKVQIVDGTLKYEGLEIHSSLTSRIIDRMNEGKNFEFFIPFLENLMLNPSEKAVQRLFDFLEANDIQITADGHFAAWKKVREDYLDIFSATFDNSVGKSPSMPRNMVDEDDDRTCSRGLHVCSKSYLGSYGSCERNRIMQVLVNPKNVVAVPRDYNNAKMRVCEYKVVADATEAFKN